MPGEHVYIVDVDADGHETSRRSYVNTTNRRECTTAAPTHAQGVSCESYDDALRNAREAFAWAAGHRQGYMEAFGLSPDGRLPAPGDYGIASP